MSDSPEERVIDLAYTSWRDERVQTAMISRQDPAIMRMGASIAGQDATLNAMREPLRVRVVQHQRMADRVRQLEEQG